LSRRTKSLQLRSSTREQQTRWLLRAADDLGSGLTPKNLVEDLQALLVRRHFSTYGVLSGRHDARRDNSTTSRY
jgi:hypothetical protein